MLAGDAVAGGGDLGRRQFAGTGLGDHLGTVFREEATGFCDSHFPGHSSLGQPDWKGFHQASPGAFPEPKKGADGFRNDAAAERRCILATLIESCGTHRTGESCFGKVQRYFNQPAFFSQN